MSQCSSCSHNSVSSLVPFKGRLRNYFNNHWKLYAKGAGRRAEVSRKIPLRHACHPKAANYRGADSSSSSLAPTLLCLTAFPPPSRTVPKEYMRPDPRHIDVFLLQYSLDTLEQLATKYPSHPSGLFFGAPRTDTDTSNEMQSPVTHEGAIDATASWYDRRGYWAAKGDRDTLCEGVSHTACCCIV
ncbi:hypothetical protein BDN71DRAFT_1437398 [Pleurotus eryngii]|uniref:Uncharacterized protein n=1 Tax=Pleurotus eryngii TaxID=5323 RepID=A0A9P6D0T6_PLEER|nr:hypothetical protein BDN71DRAFT_1437398 [Pleurotus eryngii]